MSATPRDGPAGSPADRIARQNTANKGQTHEHDEHDQNEDQRRGQRPVQ